MKNSYPLLDSFTRPSDIKKLSIEEKYLLAQEMRNRIIEVTSHNGGHLASSLGTVELAIALLSNIDIEHKQDRVIWDVGHQAYPWKLLTGRHHVFDSLRRYGGISGFLRMEESPYDHFGAGHASTSISASLGMALAHKYSAIDSHVISIIGDGSLTGGLSFEALNHIGCLGVKVIIIINDNDFSISSNVGSLSRFISRSLSRGAMRHIKQGIKYIAGESRVLEYLRKGERSFKSLVTPGMLFEALRLNYIGPIYGHDIESLEQYIQIAKEQERSVVLHLYTEKGKGFAPAEEDPVRFHGVGAFQVHDGKVVFTKQDPNIPTYTQVFSNALCELAEEYHNLWAITAAMPEGTGLAKFQQKYPERCIDVGICEAHAVTMAGGLAREGMIPVVAIYSTFLQRAYDQIIHDICMQKLHVIFCIDRAGFVGEDGATHHGMFDIAYLRLIPDLVIIAPSDENELRHALYTAISYPGPIAIRYHKGKATGIHLEEEYSLLPLGVGRYVQRGQKIAIISVGTLCSSLLNVLSSIEKDFGVCGTLFDIRYIKPLPEIELCSIAKEHDIVLLFEEGTTCSGVGSAVLEVFYRHHCLPKVYQYFGIPDSFIEHGTREELLQAVQLDKEGMYRTIANVLTK